jgi:hypothetical protein
VASAIAVLRNVGNWPAFAEQAFHDSALVFELSGYDQARIA